MAVKRAELESGAAPEGTRSIVARGFTMVEDVVYVGLGVLLSVSAIVLLGHTAISFSRELLHAALPDAIVGVLDRLLLVLMIVELLYTVQVSFREHTLVPEPFLIVGLVAATRRVLVLTAEFTGARAQNEAAFRVAMIELSVLTVLILVLVASLVLLRSRHPDAVATRG
ncbi:MAG TPA: phosphate-starvation-inducible PsiE family protein [Vicinamibacterales bacterium]|jgi:uncharacterized membrane protein (DUF373 family)|nr:phosphate-starvation-inducible PsiE family protein [Vicinamibacterales bacterium]